MDLLIGTAYDDSTKRNTSPGYHVHAIDPSEINKNNDIGIVHAQSPASWSQPDSQDYTEWHEQTT